MHRHAEFAALLSGRVRGLPELRSLIHGGYPNTHDPSLTISQGTPHHSRRSAAIGSIRAARLAGTEAANSATANMIPTEPQKVMGSVGVNP
jgi:hypothetical protein